MEDFKLEELGFLEEQEEPKVLTREQVQEIQFNKLGRLLEDSVTEIEKLVLNKPYMKSSGVISAQMKIYDSFLHHTLKDDLSFAEDVKKENRKARLRVIHLTIMVDKIRSILENLIEQDINVSNKLDKWKELIPRFKHIKKNGIKNIIKEFKD